jgi:hypothetical protein
MAMLLSSIYMMNIDATYIIGDVELFCQGKDVLNPLIKRDATAFAVASRFMNECQRNMDYHFSST